MPLPRPAPTSPLVSQSTGRPDGRPAADAGPEEDGAPADWPALWQQLLTWRHAAAPCPDRAWAEVRERWSAAAADWAARYWPLVVGGRPDTAAAGGTEPGAPRTGWVLAQLGQSLDGCIATHRGDSCFVTGPQSLHHLHRLRALADAVVVGPGTVAADNPQLTTRRVPGPHAVRVVLDPLASLDGSARLLHDGCAPSAWLVDAAHADQARARLQAAAARGGGAACADVWPVPALCNTEGGFAPRVLVDALAARGLARVLIEGGGMTVSRCLAAGVLDRLHLVVAPVLIGAGRPGLRWPGPERLRDCARPSSRRWWLGEDVLWDLDLRAPA